MVDRILRDVDASRIRSSIQTLVSFNEATHAFRHRESDRRHRCCAADGFSRNSSNSPPTVTGRLTVQMQEVRVEQPNEPHPASGHDRQRAGDASRHATRCRQARARGERPLRFARTRFRTIHFAAPGANDDASGTALVIELARVMSRHTFGATIIFACVAGEEQGLNGSAGLASKRSATAERRRDARQRHRRQHARRQRRA